MLGWLNLCTQCFRFPIRTVNYCLMQRFPTYLKGKEGILAITMRNLMQIITCWEFRYYWVI